MYKTAQYGSLFSKLLKIINCEEEQEENNKKGNERIDQWGIEHSLFIPDTTMVYFDKRDHAEVLDESDHFVFNFH